MRKLARLCSRLHKCDHHKRFAVVRYAKPCFFRYHVERSVDGGPFLAIFEADTIKNVERFLLDQFLEV